MRDSAVCTRLKSVPKLDVETSTSVWEVINFISNFEIKMRSHKVSEGDQKIYLLEALKPGVVRALEWKWLCIPSENKE